MNLNSDTSKTCHITIMGASFNTDNLGVSALAASLVTLFNECHPHAVFTLLVNDQSSGSNILQLGAKKMSLQTVNYRFSPIASRSENIYWALLLAIISRLIPFHRARTRLCNSHPLLKTLWHSDLISDIRGGDSFSDIYGLKLYVLLSLPRLIALLMDKPFVLLPQTYGPYESAIARWLARLILRRADIILSRDLQSLETIKTTVGSAYDPSKTHFCPDVAFTLEKQKPEHFELNFANSAAPLIGFNVNGLLYNGGYTGDNMFHLGFNYREFILESILMILKNTTCNVLIVPHNFGGADNINSDYEASRDFLNAAELQQYKARLNIVTTKVNQCEIKYIIGLCQVFIGSRMHSCIAALSQGIPAIGVAYSKKFLGVFDSIGLGHLIIDARHSTRQQAIDKVLAFLDAKMWQDSVNTEKIWQAQTTIRQTFQSLPVTGM